VLIRPAVALLGLALVSLGSRSPFALWTGIGVVAALAVSLIMGKVRGRRNDRSLGLAGVWMAFAILAVGLILRSRPVAFAGFGGLVTFWTEFIASTTE
jgi:hypothetical protein